MPADCALVVDVVRGSVAFGGKKRAHTHVFVLSVHRIPTVEAAVDSCGCPTQHSLPNGLMRPDVSPGARSAPGAREDLKFKV